MNKSSRNEHIMQLRHRGLTYPEIGRDPQVQLGERQVQRIVKAEEHQRQRELEVLRAKLIPRDPEQTDYRRAMELLEILEGTFKTLRSVSRRYDVDAAEALVMGVGDRRFGPACTELRLLLQGLLELDEFGVERR